MLRESTVETQVVDGPESECKCVTNPEQVMQVAEGVFCTTEAVARGINRAVTAKMFFVKGIDGIIEYISIRGKIPPVGA